MLTLVLHTESGRPAQGRLPPSDLVALCDRLDNHAGWANRDRNLNLEEDLIEAAAKLRARGAPMLDAAQKAVMKYPYFTDREAMEIAKAVVSAALTSTECGEGK